MEKVKKSFQMGYSSDTRPKMESLFPRIFLNGPGKHAERMERNDIVYKYLNDNPGLFEFLIG